jgi:hypothetical protein
MQREAPDSFFYREIKDFNIEFLGLVAAARHACHGAAFGLERPIIERIGLLSPTQLEAMASTPCLLASLASDRQAVRQSFLAEPPPAPDPVWVEESRLFAARLLTYAWQMMRRDSLHAVLCVGPATESLSAGMSYGEMRAVARRDLRQLEARFHGHPRFWLDLTLAARDGRNADLRMAQLASIALATGEMQGTRRRLLA